MTCIPRLICSLLLISKFVPGLCCIDHLSALCTTHSAARRIVPDWKCALSPLEITNHGKRLVISSLDEEKTTDETAQNVTKPQDASGKGAGLCYCTKVLLRLADAPKGVAVFKKNCRHRSVRSVLIKNGFTHLSVGLIGSFDLL